MRQHNGPSTGTNEKIHQVNVAVEFGVPKHAPVVNVPSLFRSLIQKMFAVQGRTDQSMHIELNSTPFSSLPLHSFPPSTTFTTVNLVDLVNQVAPRPRLRHLLYITFIYLDRGGFSCDLPTRVEVHKTLKITQMLWMW